MQFSGWSNRHVWHSSESSRLYTCVFRRSHYTMTTVSTFEVTSTSRIGTSIIPSDGSPLHWRMVAQRNYEPKTSRIRIFKRFGGQQGSEPRAGNNITVVFLRRRGLGLKEACMPRRISGTTRESRHDGGVGCVSSSFGSIGMLVNCSLMANVQANMVLSAVVVALGSLILGMVFLFGLSILCHPLWIVRWTQKLQPNILYLKPTQDKLVALTLDDGPHPHITPHLLDTLKENNCRATWFLIGKHMDVCPEVVERIHAEGHEVANHMMDDVASWYLSKVLSFLIPGLYPWRVPPDDKSFFTSTEIAGEVSRSFKSQEEFEEHLVQCDNRLKDFFRLNSSGLPIKWFRPGHGFYNPQIVKTCNKHGYRVALGSLYPMDHMFENQAKLLVKNLLWRMHPGAVIILHDRLPQWEQTPEVLRLLLPELRNCGYKIVTLSELEESLSNTEGFQLREDNRPLLIRYNRTPAPYNAGEN